MTRRSLCMLVLVTTFTARAYAQPSPLPDPKAQKASVKCQNAIVQAGTKLFAAKLKSLDGCSTAVLTCIQTKPGDTTCTEKAGAKCSQALLDAIPQAEVKLAAKIAKSCGAPLRPADLLAADGLGIGARAAACQTDFDLDICQDLPTLAQCLVKENIRSVERLFAAEQPRAGELISEVLSPLPLANLPIFPGCQACSQAPSDPTGKAIAQCGGAITKAGRTFAAAAEKGIGACLGKVFACVQTKAGSAACRTKASAACDGIVAKLAAARGKLSSAIDKRCADGTILPFTTLRVAAALNLEALASDCAALGVDDLAQLGDYVSCLGRQHQCQIANVIRHALPRTTELVDAGLLGAAATLLDESTCPSSLPSEALHALRTPPARFGSFFRIAQFFTMTKRIGNGPGVQAQRVSSFAPLSSPYAPRRINISRDTQHRFVGGGSGIVKVQYSGASSHLARTATSAIEVSAPTMIVTVRRDDYLIEDHLELPLDALAPGETGEVTLAVDYAQQPPSCAFDIAFAVSDGGEVSDYSELEQVEDTVPPATPVPTATAVPTGASTTTPVATVTTIATVTPAPTATLTTTATGLTPTPTVTPTSTSATPTPQAVFAYALTTMSDPVAPGQAAAFTVTVTNLTNVSQTTNLSFQVPNFTKFGNYAPGAVYPLSFTNVAAGATASAFVTLDVSTTQMPPDGTVITLLVADTARGASVSRAVVVQSAVAALADLKLATAPGTVAAGGAFAYTLAYHNVSASPLTDVELSAPVPAGASFAGTDGNGAPDVEGVVRWPIGTLAAGATGQVTLHLTALAGSRGPLVLEGTLRAGGGQVVAQASATTAVYAAPAFSYALTAMSDPVAPGQAATFTATVTNLTNAPQSTALSFRVPNFTRYGNYVAGNSYTLGFANIAAGASLSQFITLDVSSAALAPPDGTLIDLTVTDGARGVSASRMVVVQSAAAALADLKLATQQGTVAPGGAFAYTLAYHNVSPGPLAGVELSVPIPAGASFARADGNGAPDADGIVRWPIDTLAAGATGQVTLHLSALAGARSPLVVEGTLRTGGGHVVAQASAATAIYAAPVFSYALTATSDPVGPGQAATFTATVTNLTNAPQSTALSFRVPNFTRYGNYSPGNAYTLNLSGIPAGGSSSVFITLDVGNMALAPPDGTLINLTVTDGARGASVSRTVVVQSAAAALAELALATPQGTVAAGGGFAYTLAYHNVSPGPLTGVELSVPVPAGASFARADGGGAPDGDGIVRWPIGTLAAGATGQVTLDLTALAGGRGPLVLEGTLRTGSGQVVAQASATTAIDAAPAFSYALTATSDPVGPGQAATFTATVTNLTNAPQSTALSFRVPSFTKYGNYSPGDSYPLNLASIAAGASRSVFITLAVGSAALAPPDGTLINLTVTDGLRGASVARTVVVQSAAAARAELKVATTQGTVAPGGTFTYTLAFHNVGASPLAGVELSVPVPAGASFASADANGVPDGDGIVRWPIGGLAAGATGQVTLDLTALADSRGPLLLEGTLRIGSGQVVAQDSATTAIYAAPVFSYALTTTSPAVAPGQAATFSATVTNLSNTAQSASLSFRVPNFTKYGNYSAGDSYTLTLNNVAAGGQSSVFITLNVGSGALAPPAGTLITLTVTDGARGASVSRTVVTQSP